MVLNNITIKANSVASAVGNRFQIKADVVVQDSEAVTIVYDVIGAGWIISGKAI